MKNTSLTECFQAIGGKIDFVTMEDACLEAGDQPLTITYSREEDVYYLFRNGEVLLKSLSGEYALFIMMAHDNFPKLLSVIKDMKHLAATTEHCETADYLRKRLKDWY